MENIAANIMPLSKLPLGVKAIIKYQEDLPFTLTLMEMGCVPGENISVQRVAPLGDPIALLIAGYHLSIRKADAENIWVEIAS